MARKPNYDFERRERDRLKAEKKAQRAAEKAASKAQAETGDATTNMSSDNETTPNASE